MPDPKPYKPPYAFSVAIGENCAKQFWTFAYWPKKPNMPVEDLMRQANGHAFACKSLVQGLGERAG